jgi:hypothetical protein
MEYWNVGENKKEYWKIGFLRYKQKNQTGKNKTQLIRHAGLEVLART